MTPEERSLLERAVKISEENQQVLLSMRRMTRIHLGLRIFYWVLIIGISVGALYFVQPYIEFLTGLGRNSDSQQENSLELLQDLLK